MYTSDVCTYEVVFLFVVECGEVVTLETQTAAAAAAAEAAASVMTTGLGEY